jgi:hypothetical protein
MSLTLDLYGTEMTAFRSPSYDPHEPHLYYGRVRRSEFNFNTGAGVDVSAYSGTARIGLAIIPVLAKIFYGVYQHEAMGTNADLDLGLAGNDGSGYLSKDNSTTADDYDLFVDGDDVAAAGQDSFASLFNGDLNPMYGPLEKECVLVATALTADWAADKDLLGEVFFVVD